MSIYKLNELRPHFNKYMDDMRRISTSIVSCNENISMSTRVSCNGDILSASIRSDLLDEYISYEHYSDHYKISYGSQHNQKTEIVNLTTIIEIYNNNPEDMFQYETLYTQRVLDLIEIFIFLLHKLNKSISSILSINTNGIRHITMYSYMLEKGLI